MEKNHAAFFTAVALAAILLAFFGCTDAAAQPPQKAGESETGATFVLPKSDAAYFARYNVEENEVTVREVWRIGDKMRVDIRSQGIRALSLFFVNAKAYSCAYLGSAPTCYDVTGISAQTDANQIMLDESDMPFGSSVESVKIGSITGNCYEVPSSAQGARKICFAPKGVIAYDSYNVSKTVSHNEYLTEIEYFAEGKWPDANIFTLPATPMPVPAPD